MLKIYRNQNLTKADIKDDLRQIYSLFQEFDEDRMRLVERLLCFALDFGYGCDIT